MNYCESTEKSISNSHSKNVCIFFQNIILSYLSNVMLIFASAQIGKAGTSDVMKDWRSNR